MQVVIGLVLLQAALLLGGFTTLSEVPASWAGLVASLLIISGAIGGPFLIVVGALRRMSVVVRCGLVLFIVNTMPACIAVIAGISLGF